MDEVNMKRIKQFTLIAGFCVAVAGAFAAPTTVKAETAADDRIAQGVSIGVST
jgi:hypothetical protein